MPDQTWNLAGLLANTAPSDGCLMWRGRTDRDGYGRVLLPDNTTTGAHRLACTLAHGPAPSRRSLALHMCDRPGCLLPSHLYWGTHGQNSADALARDRHVAGGQGRARRRFTEAEYATIMAAHRGQLGALADRYGVTTKTLAKLRRGERGLGQTRRIKSQANAQGGHMGALGRALDRNTAARLCVEH